MTFSEVGGVFVNTPWDNQWQGMQLGVEEMGNTMVSDDIVIQSF